MVVLRHSKIDIMNCGDLKRVFYSLDLHTDLISRVYLWLLYLCIIGLVRRKEKMASGETMSGTTSGTSCIVRSMTGEGAGARAGVRAEA